MGLKSEKILEISVTTDSKEDILEYVQKYLLQSQKSKVKSQKSTNKPLVIVTPNPEQVVLAQEDGHFAQMLNQADVALPDGIGISLAMRFFSQRPTTHYSLPTPKRIPGVEFMEELVGIAAQRGFPIGLIGGRGKIAVEALECLRRKYPGLSGWAEELPELSIGDLGDLRNLGEKIKKTGTRLVFVGLGAPKQEYFIARLARECQMSNVKCQMVLMSVGGSFDTIAGRVPRAPLLVRSMGLEWLWRLILEPWRWKRQLALLKFLWMVIGKN